MSEEVRRRTPDEEVARWQGLHLEWVAEKHALTARAERAEAAEADLRATVERVRELTIDDYGNPIHDTKRVSVGELRAALDAQRPAEGGPEAEGCLCGAPGCWTTPCRSRQLRAAEGEGARPGASTNAERRGGADRWRS